MARYGSGFKYGDGTLYGVGPLGTADQAFWDALAGQSPAFPTVRRPFRRAVNELWTFDPTTWTPVTKLPYVEAGATRTATRAGVGFETQTLQFTLARAAYYLSGDGMGLLDRGNWLCIQRTVASPDGAVTFVDGVFRIDAAVSPTGAPEGSALVVTAVDWLQPQLAAPASTSGWVDYIGWDQLRRDYVTAGGTVVDYADSWGTQLAALLNYATGGRLRVESWPQNLAVYDSAAYSAFGTANLQVGDAGKVVSGYDAYTWLFPKASTFALGYDSDGYVRLMDAKVPRDSGFVVTTDNTVGGSFPPPWERPLQVQRSKPQYTRVTYFFKGTSGNTPPADGGSSTFAPDDPTLYRGDAVSWSRVHPHLGGATNLIDTEQIVESGTVQQAAGFSTYQEYCTFRLRGHLSAADTLSIPVDSAMPPGPLGRRIRVHSPADDVDAFYLLNSYSQPLSEAPSSWSLTWLEDS